MTQLTFIGTGGGRYATIFQPRGTGGLYLEDGARIHIDPGPGALVAMRRLELDPSLTDGIIVTHGHPDHYGDAEVLIEAMTRGGKIRRGTLVGSVSVLKGGDGNWPVLTRYHSEMPEKVVCASPGTHIDIQGIGLDAVGTRHTDSSSIGFRISTREGVVSYVGDSELDPEVVKGFGGCRLLIVSATRPLNARIAGHLSTEDVADFAAAVKPEMTVMTHFGMKVIEAGPESQARWVEERTGIPTLAARDGMKVQLGKGISSI